MLPSFEEHDLLTSLVCLFGNSTCLSDGMYVDNDRRMQSVNP